jgi:hypothetical protein
VLCALRGQSSVWSVLFAWAEWAECAERAERGVCVGCGRSMVSVGRAEWSVTC